MVLETDVQSRITHESSLSLKAAISNAQPLYFLPKDRVVQEVLIPALQASRSVDLMMGYFSSGSFAEIAPGLATFLRNSNAPMRMVVSPFLTEDDFEALTKSDEELRNLAERILIEDILGQDVIVHHTLECLAWLITQGRLIIKVAVMREALFHPKVWLFEDGESRAALHGSTNLTKTGLSKNREQLTLSRGWKGDEAIFHVERLCQEFKTLWDGGDEDCAVVPLSDAVKRRIVTRYKTEEMPDENVVTEIWQKTHESSQPAIADATYKAELRIPDHLVYETGDFAHQGQAIKAWAESERRGILEMATGSGKTITSMICATKLQDEVDSLLVVVSAPYRPLIEQWCGEIQEFGVYPINLTTAGGPEKRDREIKQASRRLRMGTSRVEVLVTSNDTLCTERFVNSIASAQAVKLLIADECHNLGAESFISNPPDVFDFRLGLSATPIRQYDEEGTTALIAYFGDVCFSFTLEEAIGKCLTEYDYHVHFVELTDEEMEEWKILTAQIGAHAWKLGSDQSDPYLDNLLRLRRLVLETASGKMDTLADLLDAEGPRTLRFALIYATDKKPEQLEQVNRLLQNRGVLFRQLTYEETKNRKETQEILSAFQNGQLHILTAKRVLDEGVNIPQIKLAFLLASTTVRRQWVQRRGRLLRRCKEVGKTHAVIHDFVVLPSSAYLLTSESLDQDVRKLVRAELERVWEFARLSRNGPLKDGPYEAVQYLQELANESGVD